MSMVQLKKELYIREANDFTLKDVSDYSKRKCSFLNNT